MVASEKKEVVVEKEKSEDIITAEFVRRISKSTGKISVKGVFNPGNIHKRIEKKTRKKLMLISPKPRRRMSQCLHSSQEAVKRTVINVHIHCKNCEYDLQMKLLKLKGPSRPCHCTHKLEWFSAENPNACYVI
ncbi:heavy metal-associated isoprenylated plant protein 4-like [Phoenix dactylifera]|uniref:Heavy metal-associated isoprenylated plant protein 4-like n=1 Tax=Phoenix dactylifera TaxID=42345 RepID=A0A8B8J7N0_PHODC|nr:heavy metal-associated isoprenylated plant protein 4-like [Phoenix dactylifera]